MAPGFSEDYQTLSGGREQFRAGDRVPRGAGGWEDVGGHQLLPPPKGPRRHRGGKWVTTVPIQQNIKELR